MHFSGHVPVEVDGGNLTVASSGDGPTVLALHTTTSNHLAWDQLAIAPGLRLIAPDLRGRGHSSDLPGPHGVDQHLIDLAAVAEHLAGTGGMTVAGHGTGAALAVLLAAAHPERIQHLMLVDGGIPGTSEAGATGMPDLEPVKQRLSTSFASREAYHELAMQEPAFRHWTPEIREYIDYDLVGTPPSVTCRTNFDAIAADASDLATRADEVTAALRALAIPITFLRAERGPRDEPNPLYELDSVSAFAKEVPSLAWRSIPDTNHYTILNTGRGAKHVTAALVALLDR